MQFHALALLHQVRLISFEHNWNIDYLFYALGSFDVGENSTVHFTFWPTFQNKGKDKEMQTLSSHPRYGTNLRW